MPLFAFKDFFYSLPFLTDQPFVKTFINTLIEFKVNPRRNGSTVSIIEINGFIFVFFFAASLF